MEPNMPTGETMNEGSAMPPSDNMTKAKGDEPKGMDVTVPLESLSQPGEDEKMMSPTEGDPISLYAEGKLKSISGDKAVVCVYTVNGKPLTDEAAKTANTPEMDENPDKQLDDEFEQLKQMASQMPSQ